MNIYEITYDSDLIPITLEIEADDPYSACFILGRKTKVKKQKVLKVIERKPSIIIYTAEEGVEKPCGS